MALAWAKRGYSELVQPVQVFDRHEAAAAQVVARQAGAQASRDLVGDRAGQRGQLVGRDARAALLPQQRHLVADRRPARGEGHGAGDAGALLHVTRDNPDGALVEVPPLPEGERSAVEYFLTCLAGDHPIEGLVSPAVGRDTQEILEAGLRAGATGREVSLPLA